MKAEEISEKILYLPVTNGRSESSIHVGKELIEQYAELRIQQEREKWKEEIFKALSKGAYLAITKVDVINTGIEPYFEDYYENEVKPRIETK